MPVTPDVDVVVEEAPAPVSAPAPAPAPARERVPEPAEPPWNPAEDLLPFDEGTADEADRTGLSGAAMLGWVVGAVVLVGLVMVLLRVFGVDDADAGGTATDPGSSQESEAPGEAEAAAPPETVGKAANVARTATVTVPSTAPATTDFDGELVSYTPAQMHDGVRATAWRMAGDGTGAVITITLKRPTVVSRIGLINGYAKKVSGVDWYPNNRRILSAQWGFDDGTTVEQSFAERPGMQRMKVPAVLTSTVTLTLSSVTPPGRGSLGRDYTAISEVVITGRRAR